MFLYLDNKMQSSGCARKQQSPLRLLATMSTLIVSSMMSFGAPCSFRSCCGNCTCLLGSGIACRVPCRMAQWDASANMAPDASFSQHYCASIISTSAPLFVSDSSFAPYFCCCWYILRSAMIGCRALCAFYKPI